VKAKTNSSITKIIISHSSGFLRKGQQLFAYILTVGFSTNFVTVWWL